MTSVTHPLTPSRSVPSRGSRLPRLAGASLFLVALVAPLAAQTQVFDYTGGLQTTTVPAGATIHARSRLVGAEAHRAGTLLTFESAIHVKGNEKPSLLYTSQILYQG